LQARSENPIEPEPIAQRRQVDLEGRRHQREQMRLSAMSRQPFHHRGSEPRTQLNRECFAPRSKVSV
jgi:hypothetical protein